MPMTAHIPAPMSAVATPGRTGGPPASPVMLIMPLWAWAIASYPGREAQGPVWP
jgi:hypothetical protein